MLPANPTPPGVNPAPVSATDRVAQLIYLLFGILDVLLLFRVILKLLDADPAAGFTNLIYSITAPFVVLFQGVFPTEAARGHILEPAAVLAIAVYAVVGYALGRLVQMMGRRNATPAA